MIKNNTLLKLYIPICIMVLYIGFIVMGIGDFNNNADFYFLYNRARQLLACLQDNNSIVFFYQDFNGVGYGSSFFYGYLTLVPFLPLLNLGSSIFLNAYVVFTGLLFCLGTLYLVSRFTDKYIWITCLYLLSTFVVEAFSLGSVIANFFALGLSFFFIGCCIDFFRDGKKFIWCSILFFLILNSHLITAIFCFIFSIIICICYFNKNRLKEYCLFLCITILFCSYYLYNFMIHIDNNMLLQTITKGFVQSMQEGKQPIYCSSSFMFNDIITFYLFNIKAANGYALFGICFLCLSVFIITYYYKTFSKKEIFCLGLFILGLLLGIRPIWLKILQGYNIFFQFPLRYMFYLLLGFYIIICKRIKQKKVIILLFFISFANIFFPFLVVNDTSEISDLTELYVAQINNGEYLYKDFDFNIDNFEKHRNEVIDEENNQYTYVKDKNKLYIKYDTDKEHTLTIPKLYYKGYVCKNVETNTKLNVASGVSQFISVNIPEKSKGIYELYFDDTVLVILQRLNYILVILLSGLFLFTNVQDSIIKFKLNT